MHLFKIWVSLWPSLFASYLKWYSYQKVHVATIMEWMLDMKPLVTLNVNSSCVLHENTWQFGNKIYQFVIGHSGLFHSPFKSQLIETNSEREDRWLSQWYFVNKRKQCSFVHQDSKKLSSSLSLCHVFREHWRNWRTIHCNMKLTVYQTLMQKV